MKKKFRTLAFMIILSARVVTRNLTVLFTTKGLNSAAKRLKADTMADALIAQAATFGVMSPTTAIVKGMVQDGKNIATQRNQMVGMFINGLVEICNLVPRVGIFNSLSFV